MSIEIIPNQPVLFRPQDFDESCICCEDQQLPCMLIADGDDLYAQVKMTPCGDELICGQITLTDNIVSNGDFETGDFTDWTTHDANWSIIGNAACSTVAGSGTLAQTINPENGRLYLVTFTISGYDTGNLFVDLGGTSLGGSPYTADGTYSEYVFAGAGTDIQFDADNLTACIDDISVQPLNDCWSAVDVDPEATYTATNDTICIDGSLTFVSTVSGAVTGGAQRYVLSFTISNYGAGTVDVQFGSGNTITGGYDSNGEKFAYNFFITDTQIALVFTDFIGCISDISIKLLYPPVFYAVNEVTGEVINLGTSLLTFQDDRIIFKLPLDGEAVLSYGCWRLCLINRCGTIGDELLRNGTFDTDLGNWSAGSGWVWNNGTAYFQDNGVSAILSQTLESSVNMCVSVEVSEVSEGGELRFSLIEGVTSVGQEIITKPGVYVLCGFAGKVQFTALSGAPDGILNYTIDNVSAFEIADCTECAAWCSNCINYVQDVKCDYPLIESYNDENDSYGFVWNDGAGNVIFKLAHRLRARLNNPRYPEDSNDYTFSEGSTKDTFAQSDKNWQLFIERELADERVHDVVRLQKRSDHLFITTINGTDEYWAEKGDYRPVWTEPAGSCLAPSNFRVGIKQSSLFNNLCSE